jgi:hypothetical protein
MIDIMVTITFFTTRDILDQNLGLNITSMLTVHPRDIYTLTAQSKCIYCTISTKEHGGPDIFMQPWKLWNGDVSL